MKSTRRGFLGAIAGLAAVAAAPKAEASERQRQCCNGVCGGQDCAQSEVLPTLQPGERWMIDPQSKIEPGAIMVMPGRVEPLSFTSGYARPFFGTSYFGPSLDLGGGGEHRTLLLERRIGMPLTFDAMQKDCAARGCELLVWPLRLPRVGQATATHTKFSSDDFGDGEDGHYYMEWPIDPADLDAWRREIHEDVT